MDLTPDQIVTDPVVLNTFRRIAAEEGANAARRYALRIQEEDGDPYHPRARVLKVGNGSLTVNDDGSLSFAPAGSSLTVEEEDGTPSVADVTTINVTNGKLTDNGSGDISLDLSGGAVEEWLTDTQQPEEYPGTPDVLDDEFEGGGSLDVKWTAVNDPGFDQTTYAGYLWCSIAEAASNPVLHQTPPSGTAVATYEAKVAIASPEAGAEYGEFGAVGVGLFDTVAGSGRISTVQINDGFVGTRGQIVAESVTGTNISTKTFEVLPSTWVWLQLEKTTTADYTSSNTYVLSFSLNGLIWQEVFTGAFTFANAPDRLGLFFRSPKAQTGTPPLEVLVDYFRRTV